MENHYNVNTAYANNDPGKDTRVPQRETNLDALVAQTDEFNKVHGFEVLPPFPRGPGTPNGPLQPAKPVESY